jgi:hypothetical protein
MKYRNQFLALEWTEDGLAGNLLPPRTCFVIAHDEVLVVNSC